MCHAIQQMNQESSTLLNNIKNLMEKMGWSAEQSLNLSGFNILSASEND